MVTKGIGHKRTTPSVLTASSYWMIATQKGLGTGHRDAYIKFMQKRFPKNQDRNYAATWAKRFNEGTHWANADLESRRALKQAYGVK